MIPKVGNILTNQSLKTKTLLFIVLVTAIPVWITMLALFNSFAAASDDIEAKALTQTTALIRQELLNSVGTKARIYDLTFKNVIVALGAIMDDVADESRRQKALEDFTYRNSIIHSAYYLPASFLGGAVAALPNRYTFVENGRKVYAGRWFGPFPDVRAGGDVMVYGLPIWDGDVLTGMLAFDVTVESILTEIIDIDPSESSYVLLVRNDGEVITSSTQFHDDFAIPEASSSNILHSAFSEQVALERIIAGRDESKGAFELPDITGDPHKIVVHANVPSFGARVFVVSPLDELIQVQREKAADIRTAIQRITFLGVLALLGLGVLLAVSVLIFSERVVIRPIRGLMAAVVHLEKANFEAGTDVPVQSNDEIGTLARRFNSMAARLRESYEGLERKVEERTSEIQRNLTEIERLNKFMIGRELRMRELKKELSKLKGVELKDDDTNA